MPDISNGDLKKLLQRVITKVNKIDEKLDQLLSLKCQKECISNEEEEAEFKRISNDHELRKISKLIEEDEEYSRNLRQKMENKRDLKLEDIFTEKFLVRHNLTGVYGKLKLEGLVPYEQIFIPAKLNTGETIESIRKLVMSEIHRIKKRVSTRKLRVIEERTNQEENFDQPPPLFQIMVPEDESSSAQAQKIEEQPLFVCKMEVPDEIMDDQLIIDEDPEEKVPDETIPHFVMDQFRNNYNESFAFSAINNEEDLQIVTQFIETDLEYLNHLRQRVAMAIVDGKNVLEQLFTQQFLLGYSLHGNCSLKKLVDLLPYQAVYFYVKKQMGLTLKEIELDANKEMRRIKKRWYAIIARNKKCLKKEESSSVSESK